MIDIHIWRFDAIITKMKLVNDAFDMTAYIFA